MRTGRWPSLAWTGWTACCWTWGFPHAQLDEVSRGFSYQGDAPLDMRMSQSGPAAADLVNTASRAELCRILKEYGEEPYAWQNGREDRKRPRRRAH